MLEWLVAWIDDGIVAAINIAGQKPVAEQAELRFGSATTSVSERGFPVRPARNAPGVDWTLIGTGALAARSKKSR